VLLFIFEHCIILTFLMRKFPNTLTLETKVAVALTKVVVQLPPAP
jgi:hypothetical protein